MWVLGALLLVVTQTEAPDWQLAASKDGVEVFTAPKPGRPYKMFRAVTRIEASLSEVLEVLNDVERYVEWFAFTKRAIVLEASPNEKLIYLETAFPWPFSNEDMVYRLTQTTSSDLVRLSLEGLPSARPRVDGVQRMRSANGHIEVRAVGSAVEVVYSMHTELGGGIPLWLANQNVHELPLQTLTQLKRRLEHRGK